MKITIALLALVWLVVMIVGDVLTTYQSAWWGWIETLLVLIPIGALFLLGFIGAAEYA